MADVTTTHHHHERFHHRNQEESARPDLQTLLHHGRRLALRRARVGAAHRPDHRLPGRHHLRAERRRGPQRLVDDGDQHCRQQISARHARHARARDRRARARHPRGRDHSRLGHRTADTSAPPTTRPSSTTSSPTCCCSRRRPSTRRYGSTSAAIASSPTPTRRTGTGTPRTQRVEYGAAGYTQVRSARPASSTRCTIRSTPSSPWPRPKACSSSGDRAPAPTCRRCAPPPNALRRRHRLRSAQLHERLRRLCRRHQVRRQDAPRRQDGHPQRRPSRHRRLHRVQAEGRSQGLGAHRAGLRRQRSRLRCLLVHLLPERQQLRARDRRLHVRGGARRRLLHPRGEGRPSPSRPSRPATCCSKISDATWHCGDPGMQYDTTVNRWHTSKNTARINASNPCSEYMFLDDSACNLAWLNLHEVRAQRHLRRRSLPPRLRRHHHRAGDPGRQQRLSDRSHRRNSHDYRPLGLGYANLGALLMAAGLPYDSDAGRDYAACVTAIMCGEAYLQSSKIAELCQPLAPATADHASRRDHRRRLPRLVRQSRAVPRRHPHAPRFGQQHQPDQRSRARSSKPARLPGTKPSSTARSSAIATRRSPCSRPPAPSAS